MLEHRQRFHRPLRDQQIQLDDFRERAARVGFESTERGPRTRLVVRVDWPRFFDETAMANDKGFIRKKLSQLVGFWEERSLDDEATLRNIWLEKGESASYTSVPLRVDGRLELDRVEIFTDDTRRDGVRCACKESHPRRPPKGQPGSAQDYVIRLWAAPVRLQINLAVLGPDLSRGRWCLALRYPGEIPRLYRFDETIKPAKLGKRLDIMVDGDLFDGPLGGVYQVPID